MQDLVTRHEAEWRELERLIARARRRKRSLGTEELSRLDQLYRRATVHLARARTRGLDAQVVLYLNSLTAQAHSLIYVTPRRSILGGLIGFVVVGFARCVVRLGRFHLVAAAIFLTSAVFGYCISQHDVRAAYALSMPGEVRLPGSTPDQLRDVLRHGRDSGHGEHFLFASFLFQNNLRVGILAMATGVLAGVPTILILISNGLVLGQFASVHARSPELMLEMWAWILPHGVPELSAIVLAGGAGLALGNSILRPGLLTRTESLRRAGLEAARTAGGVLGLLLIAAIIESYVRQSHLTTSTRLWFAGGSLLFWTLYFANGWLHERRAARDQSVDEGSIAAAEE